MDSRHQEIEMKLLAVIRNAGGKLPLSDLLMHYKKTYHLVPPVPSSTRLSVWMRQFKSIKVHHNDMNNQTYVLEVKNSGKIKNSSILIHGSVPTYGDNEQRALMEERILQLLEENGNRVHINLFALLYRQRYNQELLVPAGTKLTRWLQQFYSIGVDYDAHLNQVLIVARSVEMQSSASVVDNLLKLITDNDGCIGLSALVDLYKKSFSKDLLLPIGKKLSHWLCEHNCFVLTQRSSNNEVYVCIKHPVQRALDEAKMQFSKQEEQAPLGTKKNPHMNSSSTHLSMPPPGFHPSCRDFLQQSRAQWSSSMSNKFDVEFPPLVEPFLSKDTRNMRKNYGAHHNNASVDQYVDLNLNESSSKQSSLNSFDGIAGMEESSYDKQDPMKKLGHHDNNKISNLGQHVINESRNNMNNEGIQGSRLPYVTSTSSTTYDMGKSWQVIEEDQKKAAIANATRRLGYSLVHEK